MAREILFWVFSFTGVEAEISLDMALRGHYHGKLSHREINLVETLSPPISERHMRELAGLPLIGEGNVGSSGPLRLPSRTLGLFPRYVHQFWHLLVCLQEHG